MTMILYMLLFVVSVSANEWIFYSTNKVSGDHDCLFYDSRFYCRRPNDLVTSVSRSSVCKGNLTRMKDLKGKNVTTDMLFDWFHPHDNVERYARFLQNSFENNPISGEEVLCNCSIDHLGVDCSYERAIESTLADVLVWQLSRPLERTMATIACFVDGIHCNTGLICMDWRQVCDGILQCEDGSDEETCYLLEFSQCSSNEFQCNNGMCIAKEFLFDGTADCLDKSDEQETVVITEFFNSCPRQAKYDCDEVLCRKNEFSCGDGECIHWTNVLNHKRTCENLRDVFYRCELLLDRMVIRTLDSGMCQKRGSYSPALDSCTSSFELLIRGLTRKVAYEYFIAHCLAFLLVPYPAGSILTPNLKFFYNTSVVDSFYNINLPGVLEKQLPVEPHLVCLSGSLICNRSRITLNSDYCFTYSEFLALNTYPFFPISHILCHVVFTIPLNITVQQVQSQSKPDLKGRYYRCQNSSNIIALRRVNDGYIDCWLGDDEINTHYLPIQVPYRYQCVETSRPQFVSFQLLGNRVKDCLDGSDEVSPNLKWSFFRCEYATDYSCWVFLNAPSMNDIQLLFHRHCDSMWDTMDGRDEQNCTDWVCSTNMHQCKGTGQCINPNRLCDGEFDCSNGEDEFNCTEYKTKPHWTLEDRCNSTDEYFCITFDYLKDPHSQQPCISTLKVGDGNIDCIGGRDERNTFSCSDHQMLGDRFLCDNRTRCISYRAVCDGVDDCKDHSDENICYWKRNKNCLPGQFPCMNGSCVDQRCQNIETGCGTEGEHLFWCPHNTSLINDEYRPSKVKRLSNYDSFCNSYKSAPVISRAVRQLTPSSNTPKSKYNIRLHGYCNRGFYLLTKNGTAPVCFCPPSFYGDRCQFSRRRITVRYRLDRFYPTYIPPVLHILVSLLYNGTTIVDSTVRVDTKAEYAVKHDLHLLYPRPKLDGPYSVRFEAYANLSLLMIWEHAINPLDFLPVFRIAKVLRFPDIYPQYCSVNLCKNNGTCYTWDSHESNRYLCLCQSPWSGIHCERQSQNCSSVALTHSEGFCVCPEGYLWPNCFVRNTVCDIKRPCLANELCVPHSTMYEYYSCLCTTSNNCRRNPVMLNIVGANYTNIYPLVIQLLKFSSDYPRLRQQILASSSFRFPIVKTISTHDLRDKTGSVTEIGLVYTFNRTLFAITSTLSFLYIDCRNELFNITVDFDTEPRLCHRIEEPLPPVTSLHQFCRTENHYPCFYTPSYVCYCNRKTNGSECISYHQRETFCSYCLNQGLCAQGDLQNRSDFECICPFCVTGHLCQFSLKRFSMSFEWLIEKTQWGKLHLIPPVILLIIGFLFNCLTIVTLSKKKARTTGVGFILLLNAIISQFLLIVSMTRVTYLQLLRQASSITITDTVLCKSLPYIMSLLTYFSAWLLALVSVERASLIQLSKIGDFFRNSRTAIFVSIGIGLCLSGSLYKQIEHYKLISHPNSNIWCVQEIPSNEQILFHILSIAYQFLPFLLNILSAFIIILTTSRSSAASHHLSPWNTLLAQTRKRTNILLGPSICFLSQLPALIMLFLNPCTYDDNQWFSHVALMTYYLTFIPHVSLFFLYILPSPLYKQLFLDSFQTNKPIAKGSRSTKTFFDRFSRNYLQ